MLAPNASLSRLRPSATRLLTARQLVLIINNQSWVPSDVITPLYHTKGNLGGAVTMGLYSNKQVDALPAKAAVTANTAAQKALFNQIQTILAVTDPAATYVSDTSYDQVYRATLHGFYSNPVYGNTFDFYPMYK